MISNARAMGIEQPNESDQAAVARLVDELRALRTYIDVPSPERFGISRSKGKKSSMSWLSRPSPRAPPPTILVVPSVSDVRALYQPANH